MDYKDLPFKRAFTKQNANNLEHFIDNKVFFVYVIEWIEIVDWK